MSDLPNGWTAVPEDQAPPLSRGVPMGWTAVPETPKGEPYSGAILPISRDAEGNTSFDSNAGLLGMVKRAATLVGDIGTGATPVFGQSQTWNPEMLSRASELAALASPVNPAFRAGERVIPGVAKSPLYGHIDPGAPTAIALKKRRDWSICIQNRARKVSEPTRREAGAAPSSRSRTSTTRDRGACAPAPRAPGRAPASFA